MYDFANSGYTTVVITAVFAAYFVGGIAQGAPWATFAWTAALSISYAIVMLTMPAIGAWADRHAAKKRVLTMATAGCVPMPWPTRSSAARGAAIRNIAARGWTPIPRARMRPSGIAATRSC